MLILRTVGDLSRRLAALLAARPRRRWPRLAGGLECAGRRKGARRLKQDPRMLWAEGG
jgi:hypothetical protein